MKGARVTSATAAISAMLMNPFTMLKIAISIVELG